MTRWQAFDLLYLPLCLGDLGGGQAVRGRMGTGVSRFGLKRGENSEKMDHGVL